ncbi:hypothetical protein L7F22_000988 [Adiantum nelumboides]|nr:hypothetical protein [Adiantum nelumboides]
MGYLNVKDYIPRRDREQPMWTQAGGGMAVIADQEVKKDVCFLPYVTPTILQESRDDCYNEEVGLEVVPNVVVHEDQIVAGFKDQDHFSVARGGQQQHGAAAAAQPKLATFNLQALSTSTSSANAAYSATTFVEEPMLGTLHSIQLHAKLSRPLIDEVPIKVKHHDEKDMQKWIKVIKGMFQTMTFGEISISAYDTAWVAMVPSLSGSNGPQFPKCLNWIINNQFADGSWGDKELFLAYDRVCSTVACLVALKTWDIGHENIQKGAKFVQENLARLDQEAEDYMPIGFEVVFPTMLDDARSLDLDFPYDSPVVQKIREEQAKKLKRIPMELLHSRPTTLLHSLEGLHRVVDWERLLKLQSNNGSFLFSPASTACALRYTGDKKCLNYLNSILEKFHDAGMN